MQSLTALINNRLVLMLARPCVIMSENWRVFLKLRGLEKNRDSEFGFSTQERDKNGKTAVTNKGRCVKAG